MAIELSVDEARPQLSALLDQVLAGGEPIALLHDGRPAAVLLSFEDYDVLVGAVQRLTDEAQGLPWS